MNVPFVLSGLAAQAEERGCDVQKKKCEFICTGNKTASPSRVTEEYKVCLIRTGAAVALQR